MILTVDYLTRLKYGYCNWVHASTGGSGGGGVYEITIPNSGTHTVTVGEGGKGKWSDPDYDPPTAPDGKPPTNGGNTTISDVITAYGGKRGYEYEGGKGGAVPTIASGITATVVIASEGNQGNNVQSSRGGQLDGANSVIRQQQEDAGILPPAKWTRDPYYGYNPESTGYGGSPNMEVSHTPRDKDLNVELISGYDGYIKIELIG